MCFDKKSVCVIVCSSSILGNPKPWYFGWTGIKVRGVYLSSTMQETPPYT